MKRKIVPMMIVGAMLTSAVPAQAATLPMFKQSETVTISSGIRSWKRCFRLWKPTITKTLTRTRCWKAPPPG